MKPIRVLLVDDNRLFVDSVERYLNSVSDPETVTVGKAASGEEAVILVGELHPDLVLMDISMPGMGGLGATRAIKEERKLPRVVIVTVHEEEAYRAAAEAAGADGFVTKSDLTEKLPLLLRSLFSERPGD
ncbi:MAG TPA: response regulator, partial [Candidatus Kryptobacter bacterium]|nr:response regulator [Candidatus Kryptobacter bacterium]